ncbi:hypothetical protein IGB42_02626 [Andreprevotia sp. IGB-42]|uniref:TipJ family phage tail tip protein n=1 Tax=Andreprevotia sp. IGB-42 TaxID=2497473 RepID=UPI00135AFD88|nr:phage tail protein [Andreprevotia sp. IGB-42]KAF0812783.1 hypothetical protein IGB42_02626 [Andreprevotia sp. IGB-42]
MPFATEIRNIYLHGPLGELFGEHHALAVSNPADAVNALCARYPEFEQELRRQARANVEWVILADGDALAIDELQLYRGAHVDFHFIPQPAGAKSKWVGIAIGVILAVVTYGQSLWATPIFAAGSTGYAAAMGLATSLIIGGVTQLFAPHPASSDMADRGSSYGFGGPVSQYGEGLPIPIVLGRMIVPGIAVVTGQRIKDISRDGKVQSEAWLHVVDVIAEGPVAGLAHGDPMQDVYLGEVPIGRMENPPSFAFMRGTADQPLLVHDSAVGASSLEQEIPDGREIRFDGSPYNLPISAGSADYVRLTFQVPGLGYQNDGGGLDARSIKLAFEGNTGSGWFALRMTDSSRSMHQQDWIATAPAVLGNGRYQIEVGAEAAAAARFFAVATYPTIPADGPSNVNSLASVSLVLRAGIQVQINGVWGEVQWGGEQAYGADSLWQSPGGNGGGVIGGIGPGSNGEGGGNGSGAPSKLQTRVSLDSGELASLAPKAFTVPTRVLLEVLRAEYVVNTRAAGTNINTTYPLAFAVSGEQCAIRSDIELVDAISGTYQFSVTLQRPAGSDPWTLRVRRLTWDSSNSRLQTSLFLSSYTQVFLEKYNWPYTAYASYWIRAKDYPNLPDRAIDLRGSCEIDIPANYDPLTRTYATTGAGTNNGGWNGEFKKAWTDNPVWHFLFLSLAKRGGLGDYLSAELFNKWALYRMAQFCDELVPDGLGGLEPRFACNIRYADETQALRVLTELSAVFRGLVYWGASGVVICQDRPDDQLSAGFNPTNVFEGRFEYPGTDVSTRAAIYSVTWQNPANFYRAEVKRYEGVDPFSGRSLIEKYGITREKSVAGLGICSEAMALRACKWACYTDWAEWEPVTFKVGADGEVLRPGDLIEVSDPLKAGEERGFRILAIDGHQFTLNEPLTWSAGMQLVWYDYGVHPIARRVYAVSSFAGAQSVVTVTTSEPVMPRLESPVIAESDDLHPPRYRVIAFNEDERQVSAIRTHPDKLSFVEKDQVLRPVDTTNLPDLHALPPTPTALAVRDEVYKDAGQTTRNRLIASWQGGAPGVRGYIVAWRRAGTLYYDEQPETLNNSQALQPVEAGAKYDVKVWALNLVGRRSLPAELLAYEPTATGPIPEQVILQLDGPFTSIGLRVHWEPISVAAGYEIRFEDFAGNLVHRRDLGLATQYGYSLDAMRAEGGPWRWLRVKVRAIDAFAQAGEWGVLDAQNPQAAAPALTLTAGGMAVSAKFTTADTDTLGFLLWLSTEPSCPTTDITLVYEGNTPSAQIGSLSGGPLILGTTYYARASAFDAFGRDNLNYSGVVSVTTQDITQIIKELGGLGPEALTPELIEQLNKLGILEGVDLGAIINAADQQGKLAIAQAYALLGQEQGWEKRRALGNTVAGVRRDVTVIADGLEAEATQRETLAVQVGQNTAAIVTEQTARVNADWAFSAQMTVLQTDYFGNKATVQQTLTSQASAISAASSAITTLSGQVGSNTGAITDILTLNIGTGTALATKFSNLTTSVNNHTSSISVLQSSVDGLGSQWAVTIVDTGPYGKKVSGIKLASGVSGTSFDVFSNVFRVSMPDGSGSKQVFVVGTLSDGSSGVGINGNLFVDGSIYARSLAVTSLAAITANLGTVTAGVIQSPTGLMFLNLLTGYAEFSNIKVNGQIIATDNMQYGAVSTGATVSLPTGGASGSASITVSVPAGGVVVLFCSGYFNTSSGGTPLTGATYSRSGWSEQAANHNTDLSPPAGSVTYTVSWSTGAPGAALQYGKLTVIVLKR